MKQQLRVSSSFSILKLIAQSSQEKETNANLRKDSINNPICKSMVTISDKILFINKKIMVVVKLPKFAIYYIEMFIRKVPEKRKDELLT